MRTVAHTWHISKSKARVRAPTRTFSAARAGRKAVSYHERQGEYCRGPNNYQYSGSTFSTYIYIHRNIYIYIYTYTYVQIYICIYIYTCRERERDRAVLSYTSNVFQNDICNYSSLYLRAILKVDIGDIVEEP